MNKLILCGVFVLSLMSSIGCERYEWDAEKQQIKYKFTHPWEGVWTSQVDMNNYFVITTLATLEGELLDTGALRVRRGFANVVDIPIENVQVVDNGIKFTTGIERPYTGPATSIGDAIGDAITDAVIEEALAPEPSGRTMFFDETNLYEWDGVNWIVLNEAPFQRGIPPALGNTFPKER